MRWRAESQRDPRRRVPTRGDERVPSAPQSRMPRDSHVSTSSKIACTASAVRHQSPALPASSRPHPPATRHSHGPQPTRHLPTPTRLKSAHERGHTSDIGDQRPRVASTLILQAARLAAASRAEHRHASRPRLHSGAAVCTQTSFQHSPWLVLVPTSAP